MKKFYALIAMSFFSYYCMAQNVGIGTDTPTEKLDVNGNVNLNGQLKVNGNAGSGNQILMKDASNNLSWGDISEFKKMQVVDCPQTAFSESASNCSSSWFVPDGVTKILVECWGGGGGGHLLTGGGGGGYVSAKFTVTPGSQIQLTIGAGGNYGSIIASSIPGGNTIFSSGGITIIAYGGQGGISGDPLITVTGGQAVGGTFNVTGTYTQYIGFNGSPGGISKLSFMTAGATDFAKVVNYGDGGDAGFLPGSGGKGGYKIVSAAVNQTIYASQYGIQCGGGGGSDPTGGFYGRGGRIIIHY